MPKARWPYRGAELPSRCCASSWPSPPPTSWWPRNVETDQLGFTHQKFAQYYQGIRVEHADYTVHAKGGTVESISGDFERIQNLNTKPSLSETAALTRPWPT